MVIISTISKYEKFRNIGLPQNISWHQRRYCRQICLWLIKWLFEVYNEIVICHYNNIYINITPINLFPYYKQWMIIILHILKFNCNHANQLKLVDQGWPTIERLRAVFFTVIPQRAMLTSWNTWASPPYLPITRKHLTGFKCCRNIRNTYQYECKSRMKPGKEPHAARESWIGHSCTRL